MKTVVYENEGVTPVAMPVLGIEFAHGVPVVLTDEQAAIALKNPHFRLEEETMTQHQRNVLMLEEPVVETTSLEQHFADRATRIKQEEYALQQKADAAKEAAKNAKPEVPSMEDIGNADQSKPGDGLGDEVKPGDETTPAPEEGDAGHPLAAAAAAGGGSSAAAPRPPGAPPPPDHGAANPPPDAATPPPGHSAARPQPDAPAGSDEPLPTAGEGSGAPEYHPPTPPPP